MRTILAEWMMEVSFWRGKKRKVYFRKILCPKLFFWFFCEIVQTNKSKAIPVTGRGVL
jgi:hypothetical protein